MRKTLITFFIVIVLLLGVQVGVGTAQAAGPAYHVVQPGQTLFSIAGLYGVSSWAMAYANGLWNPNTIYVGQGLVVPYAGYQGYGHQYYNPGYFPVYNTHPNPPPTYNYYRPRSYGRYYTVCWGDTMSGIAWKYGVSPWAIANANHIYNLNWIYAGQQLYIPY